MANQDASARLARAARFYSRKIGVGAAYVLRRHVGKLGIAAVFFICWAASGFHIDSRERVAQELGYVSAFFTKVGEDAQKMVR